MRLALRTARKSRKLTQQDVATSLGIGRSTYSEIESGEIKRIEPEMLFGICKVLKIKATPELFEITEKEWQFGDSTCPDCKTSLNYDSTTGVRWASCTKCEFYKEEESPCN